MIPLYWPYYPIKVASRFLTAVLTSPLENLLGEYHESLLQYCKSHHDKNGLVANVQAPLRLRVARWLIEEPEQDLQTKETVGYWCPACSNGQGASFGSCGQTPAFDQVRECPCLEGLPATHPLGKILRSSADLPWAEDRQSRSQCDQHFLHKGEGS